MYLPGHFVEKNLQNCMCKILFYLFDIEVVIKSFFEKYKARSEALSSSNDKSICVNFLIWLIRFPV